MSSTPTTKAGAAFRELLDVLRDADATFLAGPRAVADAVSVAEGYRHLTHLLGYALDLYLESDPERPSFTPLASPTRKILGDNVDSRYFFTAINGTRAYRIRGRRGNDVYLSFCIYGGKPDGEWSERVVANVSQRDITFDDDGSFELVLSPDMPPAGRSELGAAGARRGVCDLARVLHGHRLRASRRTSRSSPCRRWRRPHR